MNNKPRLAESGPELWDAIKRLNTGGVVAPGGGIYHPVIHVILGPVFYLDADNQPRVSTDFGMSCHAPTRVQLDDLDDAIEKDQVQVCIMTRPGYESGYKTPAVKEVLHSPSGMSFKK